MPRLGEPTEAMTVADLDIDDLVERMDLEDEEDVREVVGFFRFHGCTFSVIWRLVQSLRLNQSNLRQILLNECI